MIIAAALIGVSTSANAIDRNALAQYASSLKGLKKEQLKQKLHELMNKKTVLKYGSGKRKTWDGFWYTDRDYKTNACINRYSEHQFTFPETNEGGSIEGMNIEHSFPKSWWGGKVTQAYCDLYNLYPCEAATNRDKSNYPMGIVTDVKKAAAKGYTKIGRGNAGGEELMLWEPGDRFKGEFSRSYMYMATTYQDYVWVKTGTQSLERNDWPTLKPWAYTLYLKWSRKDRVDSMEIARNNAAAKIQHNRNLYVDYPNLCEYVWGDSMDVAFDPYRSVTTASDDDRYTGAVVPDTPNTPDTPDTPDTPQSITFVKTTAMPESGKRYLMVAEADGQCYVCTSLDRKYGYPKGTKMADDNGKMAASDAKMILTFEQGTTGFYIKDGNDKYYGQEEEFQTIQFLDDKSKAAEWTVAPKGDGTFRITTSANHIIQYSKSHQSFGAYKTEDGSKPYPMLYVEDKTAGIAALRTASAGDDAVYSLQGVRIPADARLAPGIYIRGGKKFFVR